MAGKIQRNNFLFFRDSATSMFAVPVDKVTLVANEGDTDVAIYFEGDDGAAGSLNLAVVSTTEDTVMQAIGRLLIGGRGVTVVADDVDGVYIDDNITGVSAFTISA